MTCTTTDECRQQIIQGQLKKDPLTPEDVKINAHLSGVLSKAGMPIHKLNSMVASLQDRILCGEECQKERKKKILKQKMNKAQIDLRYGPESVHKAEKEYYQFADGKKAYRDMLMKRYTNEAVDLKSTALKQHDAYVQELSALVSTYEAETLYSERMDELLKKLQEENKELSIAIDNEVGATQTNDRKMVYETRESDKLYSSRTIALVIYYILLVCYIFASAFFQERKYLDWRTWIYIMLYIAFPLTVNILSRFITTIVKVVGNALNSSLPKNVYI